MRSICLLLALCACSLYAADAAEAWYVVRKGDNLTKIADGLGVSIASLRSDNALSGDLIRPGQRLRVRHPWRLSSARVGGWRAPLDHHGKVLQAFGPQKDEKGLLSRHTGVDLATATGSVVTSAATGVIRYLGVQEGFGLLVIVEHPGGYATVMAPLDPEAVRCHLNEVVLAGDIIGRTGAPVELAQAYLHIELRKNQRAVDPRPLLR